MLGTLRLSQPTFFVEVVTVGWGQAACGVPSKNQEGLKSSKGYDRLPMLI